MVVVVDHGAKGNDVAQIPVPPLCHLCAGAIGTEEPDMSPLLPSLGSTGLMRMEIRNHRMTVWLG